MKKVICVVEDEKAINDLVNQYLKKEGYEVRSYYTYEEASAHVGDDDVHLWILDIMLDDKSGFDLIEEIRLQGKDIPVIFMSARDKEFDRIIGLEKGSDDYITKPFSPKELVLRVNNVMKRATLLTRGKYIGAQELEKTMAQTSTARPINMQLHSEQSEQESIAAALRATHGNKSKAAQLLAIDRKTLYNKMKKYGME